MEATLEELQDAVRLASGEVAAFLRSEPDVHTLTPGGKWTVRDTAVHLIVGPRMYRVMVSGQPCPLREMSDLGAWNVGTFFALEEDRPMVLADLFERSVTSFLASTSGRGRDDPCPFYEDLGGHSTVGELTLGLIFEQLLHGADMAFGVGREWSYPASAADVAYAEVAPLLVPSHFDSGAADDLDASFAIDGPGGRFCYQVRAGAIDALAEDADTDCSISASSGQWMLWLSGRTSWEESGFATSGGRAELAPRIAAAFPVRSV
jgi:uncharacterized protein (TIGR03083 family)